MNVPHDHRRVSRRDVLTIGAAVAGGVAGSLIAGCTTATGGSAGGGMSVPMAGARTAAGSTISMLSTGSMNTAPPPHVVKTIEDIIQAKGTVSDGVLNINIDRDDLNDVMWRGKVPFLPSFEINGNLVFESLGGDEVVMNSDLAFKSSEVDPFIDQLIQYNIIFQAEHQHFYDVEPDVWFVHFRAKGDATQIARDVKAGLNVTSTPFPQAPPKNPTTPLPAEELSDIIGAKPTIGRNGVVSLQVPRRNPIVLGGVQINPYLNISVPIDFEPYGGGINAVAVSDFGMVASEVQSLVGHMRGLGWDSGCLYNQETDEHPQLYFDHMVNVGNSIQLAHQIRSGLDLLDVVFKTP